MWQRLCRYNPLWKETLPWSSIFTILTLVLQLNKWVIIMYSSSYFNSQLLYIYIYVCVCVCIYIYIYIYIERERERDEVVMNFSQQELDNICPPPKKKQHLYLSDIVKKLLVTQIIIFVFYDVSLKSTVLTHPIKHYWYHSSNESSLF